MIDNEIKNINKYGLNTIIYVIILDIWETCLYLAKVMKILITRKKVVKKFAGLNKMTNFAVALANHPKPWRGG